MVELVPSSSHKAVIKRPGIVPPEHNFYLPKLHSRSVRLISRAPSAQSSLFPSRATSVRWSLPPSRAPSAQGNNWALPVNWELEAGADVEKPSLVEVPSLVRGEPNKEFEHVASLLAKGLPGANILGLKRVQNAQLWIKYANECHKIALKNNGEINERELWHSTGNTSAATVCLSEHGFDPTYSIGTALRGAAAAPAPAPDVAAAAAAAEASGTDGNKYGIGVYFAEHALYSDVMRPSVAQEGGNEIVLAKVVLGNVKDYNARLAKTLLREPVGEHPGISYDSWSGTENDLRGVTEIKAVLESGSPSEKERAQLLVDEGHKYGRQYIVCRQDKAYPAYVVRYEVLQDAALSEPRPLERSTTFSQTRTVQFSLPLPNASPAPPLASPVASRIGSLLRQICLLAGRGKVRAVGLG